MSVGIVLVHGYSGSPDDLVSLKRQLVSVYGEQAVTSVCLPGHGSGPIPPFDRTAFIAAVVDAVNRYLRENRSIVLVGHSTGGVLVLAALREIAVAPALLVLASVPKRIDTTYLDRWSRHRTGKDDMSFTAVANMVSFINAVGSTGMKGAFPVLIVHGSDDDLVSVRESSGWEQDCFERPVRTAVIPKAGHDLFRGPNSALAVDVIKRAVVDRMYSTDQDEERILSALISAEPEVVRFLDRSPSSRRHITRCPSGRRAGGLPVSRSPLVYTEPVFANIEITTRCNLRCTYCARTLHGTKGEDMPRETFSAILELLPHAYRITLVGLGETLLHPQVAAFVAEASSQGRRTALVTNAMLLDREMSRELLKAGLESIAFSIDGPNQRAATDVRPGTDMAQVVANIRGFIEQSKALRPVSTAVFSAVSIRTVSYLEELVDVVAGLGVHVLMLTDLNFEQNTKVSLWKNADDRIVGTLRKGVARAFRNKLPVLSVHGLEEFGLWKRYEEFLLLPPDQLYQRSQKHTWCFSPWQTVPVNVHGDVTLCDCQPGITAGNILTQPLSDIWNGEIFTAHRRTMIGDDPPDACKMCPRF